jgi:S-adenosyl-L-methionine hydrolase (adenosine-forming)
VTSSRIYLVTDFGLDDEFVGVLHAVLARTAPEIPVVDLSHGIVPYDVAGGAALLARAAPHLGPGVVLAVVDPGVGTERRGVAIELVDDTGPRHLVGPDNGLLLEAAASLGGVVRAVELRRETRDAARGRTFDGRDLFAPAAGALAAGASLPQVGEAIAPETLVALEVARVTSRELEDGRVAIVATARFIDRFGNVALALPGEVLDSVRTVGLVARDEDALVRVADAFGDLEPGELGLLRDANDAVAVVVREGSAASRLRVAVGDRVELVGAFGRLP